MPNHPVTLCVPPLLEKEGRVFSVSPLLPEEGWLRSRRGGGSLPEEGWPAKQTGWWESARRGVACEADGMVGVCPRAYMRKDLIN